MIDLPPQQLAEVRDILARHLPPGCGVLAFGSRLSGAAKPYSDLDLALLAPATLSLDFMGRLREAFADSSLPIRVDLIDWHKLPSSLRAEITKRHEILVAPTHAYAA